MTSKINEPNGKPFTDKPYYISSFHLVVWLFAVNKQKSGSQQQQINKMYGQAKQRIIVWIRNQKTFQRTMNDIKNSNNNCKVKILLDWDMYDVLIESCQNQVRIIEIYIWDSKGEFSQRVNIKKSKKPIYPLYSIDEALNKAEEEVVKWTKSYKTFQNTYCLVDKPDKINRFRYILIAFINMRISDFQEAFKKFTELVCLEIPGLKAHLRNIQKKSIIAVQEQPLEQQQKQEISDEQNKKQSQAPLEQKKIKEQSLEPLEKEQKQEQIHQQHQRKPQGPLQDKKQQPVEYYQGLATYLSSYFCMAEEFHKKSLQSHTQDQLRLFYNQVMKFYQKQTFFYHIFGSNIKMLEKDGFNRMGIMLPFNHIYNSIKWLFLNQIKEKNQFYLNPSPCYRASRCKVSQLDNLQRILNKKQEQQKNSNKKDNIYIQMTGPFSTSQSAAFVLQKFTYFKEFKKQFQSKQSERQKNVSQEPSKQIQDESERQVIYRIKVNQIVGKIDPAKQDLLIHGFFKMTKRQHQGALKEKQVLFNALNVLRLVSIQLLQAKTLLSSQQQQEHQRKLQQTKTDNTSQHDHMKALDAFYKTKITVIDLEIGPFYDVLLEGNHHKLGKFENEARLNYLHCMSKIKKYHKFDYTDACFLLKEHQKCYQLLKEKIKNEQAVCIKDGKNYFEQIAKICRMLGRVTEAVKYTNLAIQCHKQLEHAHLSNVYDTHYDKLLEMQLDAIDFYHQCSEMVMAQRNLENTLKEFQAIHRQGHKAMIKQSELLINLGINYYANGKLDESVKKFKKCKQKLQKIIEQCGIQPQIPCYFFSFLRNIICKDEDNQKRYCCYSQYGEILKKKIIDKNYKKYAQSKQQLYQTSEKACLMLNLTNQALKNRRIFLKNNKDKYVSLVQSDLSAASRKNDQRQGLSNQQLEQNINDRIKSLNKMKDKNSEQYQKSMKDLSSIIDKLEERRINFCFEVEKDTYLEDKIKKFMKKEQQKKTNQLKNKNKNAKDFHKEKFVQQFLKCAKDIEKNIEQLKTDGFVDSTNDIMRQRNNLAKILQKGQQRQKALEEIKKIIDSILVEDENRYMEYATAYFTKGRIQFDMNQLANAIISFERSLGEYQKFWLTQKEIIKRQNQQKKEVSQEQKALQGDKGDKEEKYQKKEVQQEQKVQRHEVYKEDKAQQEEVVQGKKVQQKQIRKLSEKKEGKKQWQDLFVEKKTDQNKLQQSDQDDDFQMVKVMWIKAKLKYLKSVDNQQNRQQNLNQVLDKILQIQQTIDKRSLQDSEELLSNLDEVHIYYKLHFKPYKHYQDKQKKELFKILKEMVGINIKHEGQDSFKNILVYCQLVFQFHKEQNFLADLQEKTNYLYKLDKSRVQCRDEDIKWKIAKAFYFINMASKQPYRAQRSLVQAIQILEVSVKDNNKKHLISELKSLIDIAKGKKSGVQNTMSTKLARSLQIRPVEQPENSRDQFR